MSALRRFRRHAELYGAECVYEVAASDGFDAIELGQLALALRTVDHRWRLNRDERADLLRRLESHDPCDRTVRSYLGIGQDTLRRMRQAAVQSEALAAKAPSRHNGSDERFSQEAA